MKSRISLQNEGEMIKRADIMRNVKMHDEFYSINPPLSSYKKIGGANSCCCNVFLFEAGMML